MDPENLHLARHYLRRAHEHAAKYDEEDLSLIATAHEELCALQGRLQLLNRLREFAKDLPGDAEAVSLVEIVSLCVGLSDPAVLDFKAATARGVPEGAGDSAAVTESGG